MAPIRRLQPSLRLFLSCTHGGAKMKAGNKKLINRLGGLAVDRRGFSTRQYLKYSEVLQ